MKVRDVLARILVHEEVEPSPRPSPPPAKEGERGGEAMSYQQMTEKIPEDFPIVDAWLADHHPSLWRKIRDLDDELARLDQGGFDWGKGEQRGEEYQANLAELLDLCRQAKDLKEARGKERAKGRVIAVHPCGGKRFWLSAFSNLWLCEKCSPPPKGNAVKRWVEAGGEITVGVAFMQ